MTPHIKAPKGAFAKVVLMPGDPLRAKWIADNFLENPKLVNDVRGMLGFTGTYKGKRISVMASGMGIPSIGIYSRELFKFYDVDYIFRIGTTGSFKKEVAVKDIVIAESAFSFSTYGQMLGINQNVIHSDKSLVALAKRTAEEQNLHVHVGAIESSDAFYNSKDPSYIKEHNLLCTEMEAFGLYANALVEKKQALTFLTVSDSLVADKDEKEDLTPEERQTGVKKMVHLALEFAIKLI